jgi:drug/metabolite transporter (DMT)-like permease
MTATSPTARRASFSTHLALFMVQVAFASQAVESKLAMMPRAHGGEGISPHVVAMARMVGASVCFHVARIAVARLGRDRTGAPAPARLTWRDHVQLGGLSLLGIVLNQILFLEGLARTTPQTAALLSVTIPVASAALSVLFRFEAFSLRTVLGLALAAGGVLVLTGVRQMDHGAAIIALNCTLYAGYVVFSRSMVRRVGAFTVVTWIFTWGMILFAPFGLPALLHEAPSFTARGWTYMAYVVLIPTVLAYLLNAWALGRSSATLVTIYVNAQPILAALLAWVQLGQSVTPKMLVAAVLIASGVLVVSWGR